MVLRHQTGRWERAEDCQRQQKRNVYFLEVTRTLKRKLCSFILHKKLKFRTPGRFSSGPALCNNHRVCLLINLCASRKNFSALTTPTESFWPIKRQFLDTQAGKKVVPWWSDRSKLLEVPNQGCQKRWCHVFFAAAVGTTNSSVLGDSNILKRWQIELVLHIRGSQDAQPSD